MRNWLQCRGSLHPKAETDEMETVPDVPETGCLHASEFHCHNTTTGSAPPITNTHHNNNLISARTARISASIIGQPSVTDRFVRNTAVWPPAFDFENIYSAGASTSHSDSGSDSGVSLGSKSRRKERAKARRQIRTSFAFYSSPLRSLLRKGKGESPEERNHHSETSSLSLLTSTYNEPNMAKSANKNTRTKSSGKDFTTGHCMVCDRLMKWPQGLYTFRCNICATINDLKPLPSLRDSMLEDASQQPEGQRISAKYARHLVRRCIRDYLKSRLIKPDQSLPGVTQTLYSHNLENSSPLAIRHPHRASLGQNYSRSNSYNLEYQPRYYFSDQPTLRPKSPRDNSSPFRYSTNITTERRRESEIACENNPAMIFKPFEDYLNHCFISIQSVNSAFLVSQPRQKGKSLSEASPRKAAQPQGTLTPRRSRQCSLGHANTANNPSPTPILDELDHKMLLLGDVAENGAWWLGGSGSLLSPQDAKCHGDDAPICAKSPLIDWEELDQWYDTIVNAAKSWVVEYEAVCAEFNVRARTEVEMQTIERDLLRGQDHLHRSFLKRIELLLKRPGGQLGSLDDLRFLIILMENPLLHPSTTSFQGCLQPDSKQRLSQVIISPSDTVSPTSGLASGHHSGLVKRIVGLLANTDEKVHRHLVAWFSTYTPVRFQRMKDLIFGFLTYRLLRQGDQMERSTIDVTAGLIPQMHNNASTASLHAEIGLDKRAREQTKSRSYSEDWQVRAASRVLALFFTANNMPHPIRDETGTRTRKSICDVIHPPSEDRPFLPPTDFYNSLIDLADLIGDFEAWEGKKGRFAFCQYPFLLSIWAKAQILEYDAQRQMQNKARDAFFDSIMTRRAVSQHLTLNVRRECLVDDSLKAVGEVIGSGSEDVKKSIRITFSGEEGIDGGGLRKEWFLLLIREVFSPDHGMFTYDDDSHYCYFNPNSFETSDQFFLVGVVIGLAIYNSTILDVALPPFAFRKLLASAPAACVGHSPYSRQPMRYSLRDLAEYKPQLAKGLQQLLDYNGDVESTFALDFTVEVDKYGARIQVPLCEGGERKPVTNANRREYVDLLTRYWLDTSVSRQFEPFKRGFYTVCGGNAFSLFRAEEIELLIKGSDEALDIDSLRASAEYDNWGAPNPDGEEPVISWFWELFKEATSQNQRRLLSFVTGSDRLPATRASMMPIRISCLGDDCGRFPAARTCFNYLSLYKYESKEKMRQVLWRAVHESEGFGLK